MRDVNHILIILQSKDLDFLTGVTTSDYSYKDFNNFYLNRCSIGPNVKKDDFKRKLLSKYANLISMLLLRSHVRDMTSGFRCYNSKTLELIEYYNTSTNGYSFQIEMTLRSVVKKLNISEIPILFTNKVFLYLKSNTYCHFSSPFIRYG